MRACLVWVTHLLCLSSMCCLPEWNIVNNNNKYTENINLVVNGMLTNTSTDIYIGNLFPTCPQLVSVCKRPYQSLCPTKNTPKKFVHKWGQTGNEL